MNNTTMFSAISLLIDIFNGMKINHNGRRQKVNSEVSNKIKEVLYKVATQSEIDTHINYLIGKNDSYLKVRLDESISTQTTEEMHIGVKSRTEMLNNFKKWLK